MATGARVQNIDAIRAFRAYLVTFAEKASVALGEAEAEVGKVMSWLENEQTQHWTSELRKRNEAVQKAKDALRQKQIFKGPAGGKQSTVDEEKAVNLAMRRFAEAEQKLANTKKWLRQMQKEAHLYRGTVQRLSTTVQVDLPNAAAKMANMIGSLEQYVALSAPSAGGDADQGGGGANMGRAGGPDLAGGYKELRKLSPAPAVRDAAPSADPAAAQWSAGDFAPGNAAKVTAIPLEREAVDPANTVVISAGVQAARRVFLERLPAAFGGDSGWYIGPADATPVESYESVKVGDLIAARPDFASLLPLPTGTLIVLDGAGVATVLNGQDEDVWVEK